MFDVAEVFHLVFLKRLSFRWLWIVVQNAFHLTSQSDKIDAFVVLWLTDSFLSSNEIDTRHVNSITERYATAILRFIA